MFDKDLLMKIFFRIIVPIYFIVGFIALIIIYAI